MFWLYKQHKFTPWVRVEVGVMADLRDRITWQGWESAVPAIAMPLKMYGEWRPLLGKCLVTCVKSQLISHRTIAKYASMLHVEDNRCLVTEVSSHIDSRVELVLLLCYLWRSIRTLCQPLPIHFQWNVYRLTPSDRCAWPMETLRTSYWLHAV